MNFCTRCGTKIESIEAKICTNCGNPINTTVEKDVHPKYNVKEVGSPVIKTLKDDQSIEARNKKEDKIILTSVGSLIAIFFLIGAGLLKSLAALIIGLLILGIIIDFYYSKKILKIVINFFHNLKPIEKLLLFSGAIALSVFIVILLIPADKEEGNKYLASKQWDEAIEYFQDLPLEEKNSPSSQMGLNYGLAAKAYSKGNLKSSLQYVNKALSIGGFSFNPPIYHDITDLQDSIQYHFDRDTLYFLLKQLRGVIKQSSDTSNLLVDKLSSLKNCDKLCLLLSPNGKTISNLCKTFKELNDLYPMYGQMMEDSISTVESAFQKKSKEGEQMLIRRFAINKQFGVDPNSGKELFEVVDFSTYNRTVVIASPDEIPENIGSRMNVELVVKKMGNKLYTDRNIYGASEVYLPTFETINPEIVTSFEKEFNSLKSELASLKERQKSGPALLRQNIQETQSQLIKEFEVLFELNKF